MYRFILTAFVAVCFTMSGCKPVTEDGKVVGPFGSRSNARVLACPDSTISGTISASRTLSSSKVYLLSGCVNVSSGVTLTIQAGTKILAEKSTHAGLIIERGATLTANGTSTSPIVFTSDQAAGSRAPGDWRGIVVLGKANNNSSSPSTAVKNITRCGTAYASGAISGVTTDADNSGSFKYWQIHYAGYTTSGEDYPSGLLLSAVGSGTTVDHIQVTNSLKDGIAYIGGIVSSKYMVSFDCYKADFRMEFGYRGNMQFALALRKNTSANDGTTDFSNGLVIQNNSVSSTNTPYTNPVISNLSILGPGYCTSGSLSSNFKNGVLFAENARGNVYNTVVAGWAQGLKYETLSTVQNANNGVLRWMYDTFYGYAATANQYTFSGPASWDNPSGVCYDNIDDFIQNPDPLSCACSGYQSLTTGSGFSSTICGTYCSTAPTFALSSSSISNSSYPAGSVVTAAFFDTTAKPRGAFSTATSWTGSWTDWCAGSTVYCS